jgi:thiamine-monophosphate kinase
MVISELGELVLVERIRSLFRTQDERVLVSIGDDAAVWSYNGSRIIATTDLMAEGVHFDYTYTTFYQSGFKLISSNVSDVYAMGGVPDFAFLDIAMTGDRAEEEFDEFIRGVKDACTLYRMSVQGGDVSSSLKGDFYSAAVIGHGDRTVTRSGARTGDRIYLTGATGDAAAGLEYLKVLKKRVPLEKGDAFVRHGMEDSVLECVRRHLLPVARNSGEIAAKATAMIDVSDGLLIDLFRLCSESGKGALLYEEKIPVSEGTRRIALSLHRDCRDFVLSGGEDYELLLTSGSQSIGGCVRIGEIIDAGFYFADAAGTRKPFAPKGYTHFVDKRKI